MNKGAWSKQEDQKLIDYIRVHVKDVGAPFPRLLVVTDSWKVPGRQTNEVKNYWNSHIRRKLIKMGIDPNNHKLHQTLFPPLLLR
ncbi:SANT/Myb domain, partial [Sesbania bispinosa]